MEITQQIQKEILVKLTHAKQLRFNELWDKHGESNVFTYHLKTLLEKDLLIKEGDYYKLTNKGITYVSAMEGSTGSYKKKPIVCSFILGYDSETDKILINVRKKEPFYDYIGIPGGKMEFGSYPLKTAKEELMEETGLTGTLSLAGISNYNTYNDGELIHHIVAFTYVCLRCKGELKKHNREGDNKWIPRRDLSNYLHYPELVHFITTIVSDTSKVHFFNINRFQKNGVFEDIKIIPEF